MTVLKNQVVGLKRIEKIAKEIKDGKKRRLWLLLLISVSGAGCSAVRPALKTIGAAGETVAAIGRDVSNAAGYAHDQVRDPKDSRCDQDERIVQWDEQKGRVEQ